jgi:hypothetical protein
MQDPLLDLIQAEIDGENTVQASKDLRAALEKNEEARIVYHDLMGAAEAVRQLSIAEPPPDLKDRIMQRITPQPVGARVPVNEWLAAIAAFFAARPQWAVAYAAVVGIVVGGVIVGIAGGSLTTDSRSGFGTIAGERSSNTTYQERVQIRSGAVWGSFGVEVSADLVSITHELNGDDVSVQFIFDDADFTLIEPFHSSGGTSVTLIGNLVVVDKASGNEMLVLRQLHPDGRLEMQVARDGRAVLRRSLLSGLP